MYFLNIRSCLTVAIAEEKTIEVEVVEIDGVAVIPRPMTAKRETRGKIDWSVWHSRTKRLDARWWPLWLIIGFIAIVVMVIVGISTAAIFVVWRILKTILLGLGRLLSPHR